MTTLPYYLSVIEQELLILHMLKILHFTVMSHWVGIQGCILFVKSDNRNIINEIQNLCQKGQEIK